MATVKFDPHLEYWRECVSNALEDAGVSATGEQIDAIAHDIQGGAEMKSEAFGPVPDRESDVRREKNEEIKRLHREIEKTDCRWRDAVKSRLGLGRDSNIGVDNDGTIVRYGGRTERV